MKPALKGWLFFDCILYKRTLKQGGIVLANILTNIRKKLNRSEVQRSEELQRQDLLKANKDKIEDISQRQGFLTNSGLSDAEKQYILSDGMIASAIQFYHRYL